MATAQIKAKIISNKRLKDNYGFANRRANHGSPAYWYLEFESAVIAKNASPGQFVNIKVSQGFEPLLRRPVSIHRVKGSKIALVYKVIGTGTKILSTRRPQELLDVIGPLGSGFSYKQAVKTKKSINILIAGGMGVAPLLFLAEKIKLSKPIVLIGAKTKKQILGVQEFKTLGCTTKISTDDGSAGFKGRVTDLFKQVLSTADYQPSAIYACGPKQMLKAVSEIANENKINAQLSLEEHMACGIGACLGCVVSTKNGYQSVCKDGPVFCAKELAW